MYAVVSLEASLLRGFPSGHLESVCVRLRSENSELAMFSQMNSDEHSPTPPPCRWPALITLSTLAKFHLVWRRPCNVGLFPSCLVEHTLPAVCELPEYQSCEYSKFCEHLKVLIFSIRLTCFVLKSGWRSTARLPASSLVLLPLYLSPPDATAKPMASSHPFTPPCQVSARLAPLL